MDKIIPRVKTNIVNFNNTLLIKFRFINIQSLKTGESVNIGIIWETLNHEKPIINLSKNLESLHDLFPIFKIKHAEVSLKLIRIKYNLNDVSDSEMKITPTIRLSNVKIYNKVCENMILDDTHIEDELYEKYLTLQQTFTKLEKHYKRLDDLRNILFSNIQVVEILKNISYKSGNTKKTTYFQQLDNEKIRKKLFEEQHIYEALENLKKDRVMYENY